MSFSGAGPGHTAPAGTHAFRADGSLIAYQPRGLPGLVVYGDEVSDLQCALPAVRCPARRGGVRVRAPQRPRRQPDRPRAGAGTAARRRSRGPADRPGLQQRPGARGAVRRDRRVAARRGRRGPRGPPRVQCGGVQRQPVEPDPFGQTWLRWLDGDLDARIDGGESGAEVVARMGAELERIADLHRGEAVLVVSHGGVICTAVPALAGNLPARFAGGRTSATARSWSSRPTPTAGVRSPGTAWPSPRSRWAN